MSVVRPAWRSVWTAAASHPLSQGEGCSGSGAAGHGQLQSPQRLVVLAPGLAHDLGQLAKQRLGILLADGRLLGQMDGTVLASIGLTCVMPRGMGALR